MKRHTTRRRGRLRGPRGGFTLIEIIVVLILLTLATALVAPAFIFRERAAESGLAAVVAGVQQLAGRRGETLYLHLDTAGRWTVEGAASLAEGAIAEGRLESDYGGPEFTLVVGPLGSCGFDVRSLEAARVISIDPLTCRLKT